MGDKDKSGQMTKGELRLGIEPSPIQLGVCVCSLTPKPRRCAHVCANATHTRLSADRKLAVQTVIPKYVSYIATQDDIEAIVRLILMFAFALFAPKPRICKGESKGSASRFATRIPDT